MTNLQFHQSCISWAKDILCQPAYTMPNGRDSHVVAAEQIEAHEDAIVDNLAIVGNKLVYRN